jgi:1,2-phenylacetyl-CoA epoxidase PaaB subunit
MKFLATVYYRTQTNCNTFLVDVQASNEEEAFQLVRDVFKRKRPRAVRIDCIDLVVEV